ncbi:MAG TPA: hypothetical protein VFC80_04250 [Sphaerochaeta sp.]|nr:hypothetical protein [Sphaerochaeta sp.]
MKKELRLLLLILEGVITVALSVVFIFTADAAQKSGVLVSVLPSLLPTLLHLWITLFVAITFSFFYRITVGTEAALLPLLFTTISLSAIKMLPMHQSFSTLRLLSPYTTAVIYHFSLLYTAALFLCMSLFKESLQSKRLAQYVAVGFSFSLLISLMAPISINDPSFIYQVCISDSLFSMTITVITLLAILSFLLPLLEQQNRNRQSVGRPLAYALLIGGNALVTIPCGLGSRYFGLFLYTLGLILLLLVSRAHRVWT